MSAFLNVLALAALFSALMAGLQAGQAPEPAAPESKEANSAAPGTHAKSPDEIQLQLPTNTEVPPPPPDPSEYRMSSEVDLVLLDVSVRKNDGGFASGLLKDSFKVFDNKVERPIRVFAAQDTPVTVGLVVDNSGSVRPKKPEIVTAALTFVTQSNPKDEMFLVNFNDHVLMGLPDDMQFTDDRKLLREGLLMNVPQGRTALYDAIRTALEHLKKGKLDKKTLVVVSDGGDNASDTTHAEIMKMAEASLATIYTVGIFNPDDKDKNPGFLKSLAHVTGGESYMPESIDKLVGVCERIARDIRNRYTVGFAPADIQGPVKPHQIRIEVADGSGHKLQARTRTHYIPHVHMKSTAKTQ